MASQYAIHFIIPSRNTPSFDTLRRRIAPESAVRVKTLLYSEVDLQQPFEPGHYVFGNFTMQKGSRRELALRLAELLDRSPDHFVFNHPRRALGRLELLNVMFEEGDNIFRAWSAANLPDGLDIRYPVFIRDEHDHQGSISRLLDSRSHLDEELSRLTRWRRHDIDDLIVVEFCDTSDESGLFRKYSAFRIGDSIITRCLNFSDSWMVKQGDEGYRIDDTDEPHMERIREEEEYMRTNPHLPWLRKVFERAAIEYGRVDYSILDGRPQLWEINTCPQLGGHPSRAPAGPAKERLREARSYARNHFYSRVGPALKSLARNVDAAEPLYLDIPGGLGSRLEHRRRKDARRRRMDAAVAAMDAKLPGFRRLRKGIGRRLRRL